MRAKLERAEALNHGRIVCVVKKRFFELVVDFWVGLVRGLQQVLHVKEGLVCVVDLFENDLHALGFVLGGDLRELRLDIQPHFAQMTGQICVKGGEWK